MTRKITDRVAEVEHELSKAREGRDSAQSEYRSYLRAEDMAAVRGARDAIRRYDEQIEVLGDRLEALQKQKIEAEQAAADAKLEKAIKRAEQKAEAERQLSAEVGDIVERMAVLFDKLKNADSEAFSAARAAHQAADNAGRERPRIRRTPIKADSDVLALMKWAKHFAGLADSQERSCLTVSEQARRNTG